MPEHRNNGEEADYAPIADYSKGLPRNEFGEAEPAAYRFRRGPPAHQPASGLSVDLEGPDAQALTVPPAPRIDRTPKRNRRERGYIQTPRRRSRRAARRIPPTGRVAPRSRAPA